jgi:hypothetical protein
VHGSHNNNNTVSTSEHFLFTTKPSRTTVIPYGDNAFKRWFFFFPAVDVHYLICLYSIDRIADYCNNQHGVGMVPDAHMGGAIRRGE